MMITEVSPKQLNDRKTKNANPQCVDVRERQAFASEHVPGSLNIPLAELDAQFNRLDTKKTAYLIGNSETDEDEAALTLARHGDKMCCVLDGGIGAWKDAKLPLTGTAANHKEHLKHILFMICLTLVLVIVLLLIGG